MAHINLHALTLATLSFKAWSPHRLHRPETLDVRARRGTNAASVRVTLTDDASLKAVRAAKSAIYAAHTRYTLPTPTEGLRVLIAGRQLEHAQAMQAGLSEYWRAVDAFGAAYPAIRASAPTRLGALYDAQAWPEQSAVKAAFDARCEYLPCPSGGAWDDWAGEALEMGRAELKTRLSDALSHYTERLQNADRLHASVAEDLQAALADILQSHGLVDAATLAAARAASALQRDVRAIASDDAARAAEAQRGQSIFDALMSNGSL